MNKIRLFGIISLLLVFQQLKGQNLDISGTTKISQFLDGSEADSVVVKRDDSILGTKSISSLFQHMSVSPFGDTLYLTDGGFVIIPGISTANSPGPVDGDNNHYSVVQIGSQEWLGQNLITTKYNDGTPIPEVQSSTAWSNLNSPAYSWYFNDMPSYGIDYGAIYNYYTVADTNSLNICPVNWHVPTDMDIDDLVNFLGGITQAGGQLKEVALNHWNPPNSGATNLYNFSGRGSGYRNLNGTFLNLLENGLFWTSTEANSGDSWLWGLSFDTPEMQRSFENKESGFSVRCIKD